MLLASLSRPRRLLITILVAVFVILLLSRDDGSISLGNGPVEVLNSTLGFQQIFVVNLAERTDRRDAMALAGAVTGLDFTFMPGVRGADVLEKVLPPGPRNPGANWVGTTGSWRAHMNVLQRIVQENITSALIMEDDADWDVRLKMQAQTFALASRAYIQPLKSDHSQNLSGMYRPDPPYDSEDYTESLLSAPSTLPPRVSPYGDDWDVLWLGHVGSHMPSTWRTLNLNIESPPASLLTLSVPSDDTVAIQRHLKRHPFASEPDLFASRFPPHTRIVHESRGTAGIQAYAVSQRGARRLLLKFGLEKFSTTYDLLLRDWCDGMYSGGGADDGAGRPVCVTTQPPLVSQWYAKGGSDIHGIGGGYFKKTGSSYIRHSVMLNLRRLVWRSEDRPGDVEGLTDQWPDEGKGPW